MTANSINSDQTDNTVTHSEFGTPPKYSLKQQIFIGVGILTALSIAVIVFRKK